MWLDRADRRRATYGASLAVRMNRLAVDRPHSAAQIEIAAAAGMVGSPFRGKHRSRRPGIPGPMSDPVKQRIRDYISSHRYLALATAGPDGKPAVHTMGYVAIGDTVYCSSFRDRRKVSNILGRRDVAYVVHEHYDDPGRIQGVQMLGKAAIVQDPVEISDVAELMLQVFPPFARRYPSEDIVFIRIEPVEALLIDFSTSLDHSERVIY